MNEFGFVVFRIAASPVPTALYWIVNKNSIIVTVLIDRWREQTENGTRTQPSTCFAIDSIGKCPQ